MAHPDLDELLNAVVPIAQQMLSKHGEFYPFGSIVTADGKAEVFAAYEGDDQPPSQQLIDSLTQILREKAAAGTIRAAAICYDARIVPPGQSAKTDAICLSAEHQNGEGSDLYLPYKKGWFGKISYGELFAGARDRVFFA